MRNITKVALFLLVFCIVFGFSKSTEAQTNTQPEVNLPKKPEVQPNPMRGICAYMWDEYYEKEKIEINVSTRGDYDETLIFTCPLCSYRSHLVDPFLNTEYQGKTGMDRVVECGFTQVVFRGGRGMEEIVVQVPKVKPDPVRSTCAKTWNAYYENENSDIRVSTRGDYDETIVFACSYCNLENQFVNPFLNNEYQGKSGIARIKECGFIEAVFEGERGVEPIVVQVP